MGPHILHIESSSRACSVALSSGDNLSDVLTRKEENVHSAALVPMIRELLERNALAPGQLDAIAVSIGPGSYTGLRVGLSTAKAMCFASRIPLIAVSTLQSLAWTCKGRMEAAPGACFVAVLDARRLDAYTAVFDNHGRRLTEDGFMTVTAGCLDPWLEQYPQVVICGEGMSKWEGLQAGTGVWAYPLECSAENLIASALVSFGEGHFEDVRTCVPRYVKAPNITVPA